MTTLHQFFENYPWVETALILLGALLGAWLISTLVGFITLRVVAPMIARTRWQWDDALLREGFFQRLAQVLTPLTLQYALPLVPGLSAAVGAVLYNLASATTVLLVALALAALLNAAQHTYLTNAQRTGGGSIKSYVQVGKLLLFAVAAVIIISILIDKSPLILLSGLGAMSAVLLLVFRDTLLSFVASVQLTSNDIVRIGDWIEVPQFGADGDVIDMALHTVTVRNWDNTITTIPTWRLISESFKNWRGMQESGGRRIKRSLRLDTHSVEFLNETQLDRLSRLTLLQDYLRRKQEEIEQANRQLTAAADIAANRRRLTNIGTFRAYALSYLNAHPDVHRDKTCMVRSMDPGAEGVPIEIYCFTNTTAWGDYERIQSDIFDHLLSILPEFGLRLFQNPAGADLRALRRMSVLDETANPEENR